MSEPERDWKALAKEGLELADKRHDWPQEKGRVADVLWLLASRIWEQECDRAEPICRVCGRPDSKCERPREAR